MSDQERDAEQRWEQVCNRQGWNEESQIVHLEGFLREKGLFAEFAAYAEQAGEEENGDRRVDVLEGVGYSFKEDSDQPGMWVWIAPTDGCDVSFSTKEEAVESAWSDAVRQAMSILQMTDLDWSHMTAERQMDLVESSLSGD